MSISDVIKKSFLELESFTETFTVDYVVGVMLTLLASLVFGLFINFIYTRFYRGVVYNRSFSITIVGMTVMTAMVTLAISSNVVISLGMVGALSIVRFRTAVKDPLDLLYLFWAITTGITLGASMYALAVGAAVVIFVMILLMSRKSTGGQVYIAILHYRGAEVDDEVRLVMGRMNYRVKSKTIRGEVSELAMEVFVKGKNMSFVERLKSVKGVEDITVIQYDGEYHG